MSKKHKLPRPETCDERCDHFCYIGEGDTICDKVCPPKWILEDWNPTKDFFWCGGGMRK